MITDAVHYNRTLAGYARQVRNFAVYIALAAILDIAEHVKKHDDTFGIVLYLFVAILFFGIAAYEHKAARRYDAKALEAMQAYRFKP